jgi:ABC-2 type transport system ATP-binding protein
LTTAGSWRQAPPEELKRRISGDVITLTVSGDPDAARSLLAEHPGVREIVLDGRSLRLAVEQGEEALPGLLRTLDAAGVLICLAAVCLWLAGRVFVRENA